MKPAAFVYHRPESVDEALEKLAEHGDDAKILAGGQSLVPAMNFRLAQPAVLIDINRLAELDDIREVAGGVNIGALVRQRTAERNALIAARAPLVSECLPYVAHVQIRNRGTVGGSLAHADPAAELPAVMVALGARMLLRRRGNQRWIEAADFFTGLLSTALAADEMLAAVEVPAMAPRSGVAFCEFARRHGDYALAGAAAVVTLDEAGRCVHSRLVFLSVGDRPTPSPAAAKLLQGERLSAASILAAAEAARQKDINPHSDVHASAAYRRYLAGKLAERALTTALANATR